MLQGFVEDQLEQSELEEGSDVPEFINGEGFVGLQRLNESGKRRTGKGAVDSMQIGLGDSGDAGLFWFLISDNPGQAGHEAGAIGDGAYCGPSERGLARRSRQFGVEGNLLGGLGGGDRQLGEPCFQLFESAAPRLDACGERAIVCRA